MRILLTGADGYIGVIMGPKLIEAGHDVIGPRHRLLPPRLAVRRPCAPIPRSSPRTCARSTVDDLEGFDAVVHLSELSNDPIGENDPGLTMAINHKGSVGLAEKARAAGVKRFVYASSCSTYGAGGDEMRTEKSDLAPQTAYAQVQDPRGGGTSARSATTTSPRSSCATPPPTAPARASASTSCSTTSAASPTPRARSA